MGEMSQSTIVTMLLEAMTLKQKAMGHERQDEYEDNRVVGLDLRLSHIWTVIKDDYTGLTKELRCTH